MLVYLRDGVLSDTLAVIAFFSMEDLGIKLALSEPSVAVLWYAMISF